MKALALVCTLTPSPDQSSTELLAKQVLDELEEHDCTTSLIRVVDRDVKPGVKTDMGDGDEWPAIRDEVIAAQILVLATPIWLGHPSSVCQRVMERLDAELAEEDDEGRPLMYGKVATVAVVGNEDGAHHVSAEVFQGLNDIGFTIPAGGCTYWVGEAMQGKDYQDLEKTPSSTATTTRTLAANALHCAQLLSNRPYRPS